MFHISDLCPSKSKHIIVRTQAQTVSETIGRKRSGANHRRARREPFSSTVPRTTCPVGCTGISVKSFSSPVRHFRLNRKHMITWPHAYSTHVRGITSARWKSITKTQEEPARENGRSGAIKASRRLAHVTVITAHLEQIPLSSLLLTSGKVGKMASETHHSATL
jgi:hypothetical protein